MEGARTQPHPSCLSRMKRHRSKSNSKAWFWIMIFHLSCFALVPLLDKRYQEVRSFNGGYSLAPLIIWLLVKTFVTKLKKDRYCTYPFLIWAAVRNPLACRKRWLNVTFSVEIQHLSSTLTKANGGSENPTNEVCCVRVRCAFTKKRESNDSLF